MFSFKPKKVFQKLTTMDRRQAYTVGAIIVVVVIVLMMLVSGGLEADQSIAGMNGRGYDLATMPFVNDEAERYLLANVYPDMQENGSTLLYSAQQKEARQEREGTGEDETEQPEGVSDEIIEGQFPDAASLGDAQTSSGHGYGGYKGGHTPTTVGQLGTAKMGTASGSGINATWGPSGDFRQFKGRENRGNEAPVQLKTDNARQALAQFRAGSMAADKLRDNKLANARKAVMGGNVFGADAAKGGIDMDKIGGLAIDPDALPSSTDLDALDDAVDNAAKEQEKPKEDDKLPWWKQMLQDLAKQAASSLVDSIMGGIGDTIKGNMSANAASRAARKQYGAEMAGKKWGELSAAQQAELTKNNVTEKMWNNASTRTQRRYGSQTATGISKGAAAKQASLDKHATQIGGNNNNNGGAPKCGSTGKYATWDGKQWNC